MSDFIKHNGLSLKVAYVDVSLSTGLNNGDTVADAYQTFPDTTALSANTAYLIRRTENYAIARKAICPNNNVVLIGMPAASGQLFYSELSNSVKSAWLADLPPVATICVSGFSSNVPFKLGTTSSNGGYGLYNIIFAENPTALYNQKFGLVHLAGSGAIVDNCVFCVSGQSIFSDGAYPNYTEWTGLHIDSGDGTTVNSITAVAYGYGESYSNNTSYSLPSGLFIENYSPSYTSNLNISNSTFVIKTATNVNARAHGLYVRGYHAASTFKNLKFYSKVSDSGSEPGSRMMVVGALSNACVVQNISGWASYSSRPGSTTNYDQGIVIGAGSATSDYNTGHRKVSNHLFKDIYLHSYAKDRMSFVGMNLGPAFTDCTFQNITIVAPSASNYSNTSMFKVGSYSYHNTYDNLYIDYGADLNQTIYTNNTVYAFEIGDLSYSHYSKSYLKNSIIKSCKYAIVAYSALDVENTSVTGYAYLTGDSIAFNRIEAPISGGRYASNPDILYHVGGSSLQWDYGSTNTVIRVNELVNKSSRGMTFNYGTSLMAVEVMSAAGTQNTFSTASDTYNAGAIYLNNYPRSGYWMAQNLWHKFATSVVQFTTPNNVSSGFSLEYIYLNTYSGLTEQALIISPPPYKGAEIITTQTLQAPKQYNAVLYFATKYASPVTSTELWFELEIPDGASGTQTRTVSTRYMLDGIETDTSGTTWIGETPLNIYKITLPFMLDRQESVYSRIYWNKSMPGGTAKAFIAPRIIIE